MWSISLSEELPRYPSQRKSSSSEDESGTQRYEAYMVKNKAQNNAKSLAAKGFEYDTASIALFITLR